MRIGFVGLGAMGRSMALRLLDQGHTLAVHNRTRARAEPLLQAGARFADSPADAAAGSDLVISMVSDDAAAEAVTGGPTGILSGLAEGAVHVSCSTISVALAADLARRHAERGRCLLSAPVLGRPPAARCSCWPPARRRRSTAQPRCRTRSGNAFSAWARSRPPPPCSSSA